MGLYSFFSSFKSNSTGATIRFNNNCELDVDKPFQVDNGNVSVDDLHFLLVNLYVPNLDTPAFYTNLFQHIELDSMNYKSLKNPKSRLELRAVAWHFGNPTHRNK